MQAGLRIRALPSVWAMSCCNIQQASWCSTTQVKAISCCLSIRQRCIKLASLGVAMACTPGIRLLHHSCYTCLALAVLAHACIESLTRSLAHSLTHLPTMGGICPSVPYVWMQGKVSSVSLGYSVMAKSTPAESKT